MTGNILYDSILVAVLIFAADICWARYTLAAANKQPLQAGLWSFGIYIFGGISVTSYIENHWLLLPAAFGAFMGSYIGIRSNKE
jgi:hypothetical protein